MPNITDVIRSKSTLKTEEAREELIKNFYHHVRETIEEKTLRSVAKNNKEIVYDISHLAPYDISRLSGSKAKKVEQSLLTSSYYTCLVKDIEDAGAKVEITSEFTITCSTYRLIIKLP